jgi:hypothetical protein
MPGHNHQQVYNWVVDAGDEDHVVGNAGDVLLMGERSDEQILLVMNGILQHLPIPNPVH